MPLAFTELTSSYFKFTDLHKEYGHLELIIHILFKVYFKYYTIL